VLSWLWHRSKRIGELTVATIALDAELALSRTGEQVIYSRPAAADTGRLPIFARLRALPGKLLVQINDVMGWLHRQLNLAMLDYGRTTRFCLSLVNRGMRYGRATAWSLTKLAVKGFLAVIALLLRIVAIIVASLQYLIYMLRYYQVRSWRWLRPHLYALDVWLERWSLAAYAWAGHRLKRYETVQVGMEMLKQGKLSVKRLIDK
jgi:hypothetical protein